MSTQPNSFFFTDAALPANSPSYVERKADQDLYDGLCRGDFCYVLTSSQMGKSSLMVRTATRLRALGFQAVVLDLANIGTNLTAEQWYYGLVNALGRSLKLEDELDEFWFAQERLGPVQRLIGSLRSVILPELKRRPLKVLPDPAAGDAAAPLAKDASGRLVVFIDEINLVRGLPFSADELFTAIQCCYQSRAEDPAFEQVTFCLFGIATPNDLIRDTGTTSPFIIGRRIELTDFAPNHAAALARGLETGPGEAGRSPASARELLERILYWTNGHPYLTQRLGSMLAADHKLQHAVDVDRLCDEVFFCSRAREQDPNLMFVRQRILGVDLQLGALLKLYERVWNGEAIRDDETNPLIDTLRLSGVVRLERGLLVVRNRIYHRAFDAEWIRANLPTERPGDPSSIAVLPFKMIGPDRAYEYLADGIADELINALGQVPGLRVASRNSAFVFKDRMEDVRKIGAQLSVQNLVEGSVRQTGPDVQISAQLVHVRNGHCVWSESYLHTQQAWGEIQNKITAAIIGKLKAELGLSARAAASARTAENPEAYNLYLKGRFYWNRRTESGVRRSIELFQDALKKDPECAVAYAGLADAFNILATYAYARPKEAYPKAKAAAIRALEIDENLAQAHGALGCTSSLHDWNWPMAEAEFKQAIDLNPSYALAHHWYAINCLTPLGRHEEALVELRQAQEVDPLSISITASIGLAHYFAGRYAEALEQCREAVEMESTFWLGHLFLGWACIQLERYDDAVAALQSALSFGNRDPVAIAALAHAYATMQRRAEAANLLGQLDALAQTRYVPAMDVVPIYLALDDLNSALVWLERAVEERSFKMIYLKVDPRLRKLQDHPRCFALRHSIGLEA